MFIGMTPLRSRLQTFTAIWVSVLGLAVPALADAPIMSLPGKFDVTPTGGSIFTVPIMVPPGTAGMVPSLSLEYSSQYGNGVMGVGWHLNGLPAITRCPQIMATEGVVGSVTYTPSDALCLDGQKLIAISGTNYWAAGTEYRTEIDGFSRIVGYSLTPGGTSLDYFEVQTKSGQTMEFGNPNAPALGSNKAGVANYSQIYAGGSSSSGIIRTWAVDKISDTKSNYLTITYNNLGTGETEPLEIDYTGNLSANNQAPYNSVKFVYGPQTTPTTAYQLGYPIPLTKILTDVQTFNASSLVMDYHITYGMSSATSRNQANSIAICAGSVSSTTCLPATNFTYQLGGGISSNVIQPANGTTAPPSGAPAFLAQPQGPIGSGYRPYIGNFMGNGRGDVLWVPQTSTGQGTPILWQSNGDGSFTRVNTNFPSIPPYGALITGDFNGDGKTDIMWNQGLGIPALGTTIVNVKAVLYLNNGQGVFSSQAITFLSGAYGNGDPLSGSETFSPNVVDINGDGISDILWTVTNYDNNTTTIVSSIASVYNGNVSFNTKVSSTLAKLPGHLFNNAFYLPMVFPVDYDGDGKSDLMIVQTNDGWTSDGVNQLYHGDGLGNFTSVPFVAPSVTSSTQDTTVNFHPYFGNFTDSGKTDILWSSECTNGQSCYFPATAPTQPTRKLWSGKGDGTFSLASSNVAGQNNALSASRIYTGDFRGIGRTDIMFVYSNHDGSSGGTQYLYLSNGDGSFSFDNSLTNLGGGVSATLSSGWLPTVADIDGSGKQAIFWINVGGTSSSTASPTNGLTIAPTSAGGNVMVWQANGNRADLLSTYTTGLGAIGTVAYDTPSSGHPRPDGTGAGLYASCGGGDAGLPSAQPDLAILNPEIVLPVPVVTQVQTTTATTAGGLYTSYYWYSCSRVNFQGRGYLGFAESGVIDPQSATEEDTWYRQDFPFFGVAYTKMSWAKYAVSSNPASIISTSLKSTTNTFSYTSTMTPNILSSAQAGNSSISRYFPYVSNQQVISNDIDFSTAVLKAAPNIYTSQPIAYAMPTVNTNTVYDCVQTNLATCYGNPVTVTTTASDGYNTATTNTYVNDTSNWFLGRLTQASVTRTGPNGTSGTRATTFTYDPGSGLLMEEAISPTSDGSYGLTTDYLYDSYGNKISATVSGADIATRTAITAYDSHGQFPLSVVNGNPNATPPNVQEAPLSLTNVLGQATAFVYDLNFGSLTSATDLNGHITSAAPPDGFGRTVSTSLPDGTTTSYSYTPLYNASGCGTGAAAYTVTKKTVNGSVQVAPTVTANYDCLGRVIQTQSDLPDGSQSYVQTQYDANGRVTAVSQPYLAGAPPASIFWTSTQYDQLGRVTQVSEPVQPGNPLRITASIYQGTTQISSNPDSQTLTTTKNSQGLIVTVKDALNSPTASYTYDAYGNMLTATDVSGNTTTFYYDGRGRKIGMQDPDAGSRCYAYDALGEVTYEYDNNAASTSPLQHIKCPLSVNRQRAQHIYDVFGRTTSLVEPTQTSSWTYDTALNSSGHTNAIGLLATATVTAAGTTYARSVTYDDTLSRPSSVVITIDGTSYTFKQNYDGSGRPSAVTYADGSVVTNTYDQFGAHGYLTATQVTPANGSQTGLTALNQWDAEMHATRMTAGNGVVTTNSFDLASGRLMGITATSNTNTVESMGWTYDPLGNITTRTDANHGPLTETFSYDLLNRVTKDVVNGYSNGQPYTYTNGFSYDATGNLSKSDIGAYTYPTPGKNSIQPHAVQSIAGAVNATTNPSFTYDSNGNLTAGAGRSIAWTSFDMPASITSNGVTDSFAYDDQHQRIKRVVTGTTSETTYYLSALGAMAEKTVPWRCASRTIYESNRRLLGWCRYGPPIYGR